MVSIVLMFFAGFCFHMAKFTYNLQKQLKRANDLKEQAIKPAYAQVIYQSAQPTHKVKSLKGR